MVSTRRLKPLPESHRIAYLQTWVAGSPALDRKANLLLNGRRYEDQPIRVLSLLGMFIAGSFDASVYDICTVELRETGSNSCLTMNFTARIARVEQDGMVLEFQDMQPDSYMFLQTIILYATPDPLRVAEEFLGDFPPNKGGLC